jgi:hypothetical protein
MSFRQIAIVLAEKLLHFETLLLKESQFVAALVLKVIGKNAFEKCGIRHVVIQGV